MIGAGTPSQTGLSSSSTILPVVAIMVLAWASAGVICSRIGSISMGFSVDMLGVGKAGKGSTWISSTISQSLEDG